ncbi:MAG: sulfatase-like hydrolase/transferase, partial [Desulfatirhabdiaceae bacterium]
FYASTVFVMVADHGARVYGSQDLPIRSYEIPFFIIGPAVVTRPARIDAFGCSMDVTPTLLGLIGRPYESMFFGRDLLKGKPENERVLMHHNRDAGMYRLERMVSLELNRSVQYYHGNPKKEELLPVTFPDKRDLETERYAVALFQTADDMYVHEQYRIDF